MKLVKSFFIVVIYNLLISANAMAKPVFNVKTYGAKGNGRSDDKNSIQKAIEEASKSGGGTVFFPAGIYLVKSYTTTSNYLENYILKLRSNIKFQGAGNNLSIIKLGNHLFDKKIKNATAHLFYGYSVQNISFSNLLIDMNGSENIVPKGFLKNYSAIFTKYGSDFIIRNIIIQNTAGRTMMNIMGRGTRLTIENCQFINGGTYPGNGFCNPYQDDFSFIYSEWDNSIINNNVIEQEKPEISLTGYTGGIEIHGSNSQIKDNTISGCWPSVYITSSRDTVMYNVTVRNNIMKNCLTGISFWLMDTMKNIEISSNNIELTHPRNNKLKIAAGIIVPNGNSDQYSNNLANNAPIYYLKIDSNKIAADSMNIMSAGMIIHSLHNSLIMNNTISGMNYGGITMSGSKWGMDSLIVTENTFTNFRPNQNKNAVAGFLVITDTYSFKYKNAPVFKNVIISENKFIGNNQLKSGNGKFFGSFVALPKKAMEGIEFFSNYLSDNDLPIYRIETK